MAKFGVSETNIGETQNFVTPREVQVDTSTSKAVAALSTIAGTAYKDYTVNTAATEDAAIVQNEIDNYNMPQQDPRVQAFANQIDRLRQAAADPRTASRAKIRLETATRQRIAETPFFHGEFQDAARNALNDRKEELDSITWQEQQTAAQQAALEAARGRRVTRMINRANKLSDLIPNLPAHESFEDMDETHLKHEIAVMEGINGLLKQVKFASQLRGDAIREENLVLSQNADARSGERQGWGRLDHQQKQEDREQLLAGDAVVAEMTNLTAAQVFKAQSTVLNNPDPVNAANQVQTLYGQLETIRAHSMEAINKIAVLNGKQRTDAINQVNSLIEHSMIVTGGDKGISANMKGLLNTVNASDTMTFRKFNAAAAKLNGAPPWVQDIATQVGITKANRNSEFQELVENYVGGVLDAITKPVNLSADLSDQGTAVREVAFRSLVNGGHAGSDAYTGFNEEPDKFVNVFGNVSDMLANNPNAITSENWNTLIDSGLSPTFIDHLKKIPNKNDQQITAEKGMRNITQWTGSYFRDSVRKPDFKVDDAKK